MSQTARPDAFQAPPATDKSEKVVVLNEHEIQVINASGHKQELARNFNLWNVCAIGLTTGNVWVALGGSVAVAIYNGGPSGVIYEFLLVNFFYWLVGASIAELASAIPSSSGVYHWAFATAGRYGRPVAFFAGHWNFLCWIFGAASMSAILANQLVSMYALFHPDFVLEAWNVFVAYLCCTWLCCITVLFFNRTLPFISNLMGVLILLGVLITILVCAIYPSTASPSTYASASSVFGEFTNQSGYSSSALTFLLGMLNGAYAVATPDCVSHLAEEMPNPSRNLPLAIAAQMSIGFVTAFAYIVALFFAVPDVPAALAAVGNASFPLAGLYLQATQSSRAATTALLLLAFLPTLGTCVGCYVVAGRTWWTLARDRAVPGSRWFSVVSTRWGNPFAATLLCGALCTLLGAIYVGSTTAFSAFVGSFVVLGSASYTAAIAPHVLVTRRRVVRGGWFEMSGWIGWAVNGVSVAYMVVFIVLFCFPYAMPFDARSMNYSSLIAGGWTVFVAVFWAFRRKTYVGPPVVVLRNEAGEGSRSDVGKDGGVARGLGEKS